MADKLIDLRVFADEAGRMNLSLTDAKGEALIVSQFTLFADMSRGRRPSLLGAGDPKQKSCTTLSSRDFASAEYRPRQGALEQS